MQHGNEYRDLMPVWDWQRIPGTTVELAPAPPRRAPTQGETAFAGGVSDGSVGIAAFQPGATAAGPQSVVLRHDVVVCPVPASAANRAPVAPPSTSAA